MKLEMYLSMIETFETVGEVLDFLQIVSFSALQPCQFSALYSKAVTKIKILRGVIV